MLFLQVISSFLQTQNRIFLDPRWVITPVGGADKVGTFVALIGAQSKLNIAALIDFQKKDHQQIANLYKSKLLKRTHVLTYVAFTGTAEADIEDMFDVSEYIKLVNAEYVADLQKPFVESDLPAHHRIVVRIEEYLKTNPLKGGIGFNHYRPARYVSEHAADFTVGMSKAAIDRFEDAFKKLNALIA